MLPNLSRELATKVRDQAGMDRESSWTSILDRQTRPVSSSQTNAISRDERGTCTEPGKPFIEQVIHDDEIGILEIRVRDIVGVSDYGLGAI